MFSAFDVNMGVKQGFPTSPGVFYLFLNRLWDFIAAHTPPSWHVHTLFLVYADDLVLIVDSLEQLQ